MNDTSIVSVRHIWIAIPVVNKFGEVVRHRKVRKIKGPFRGVRKEVGTKSVFTFAVGRRAVKGDFVLTMNNSTGNALASADSLTVHHKLAKRKYVVVGYDMDARITNTNRRSAGHKL